MITLDDDRFTKVLQLRVNRVHTWADMTPGRTDRERRERLRSEAVACLRPVPGRVRWWAVRVTVSRAEGKRPLDIENVLKPVLDAFCARQVKRDKSQFPQAALYPDDSIDHVRVLQVEGQRSTADETLIEVFACVV
jgi:hypothetical protein